MSTPTWKRRAIQTLRSLVPTDRISLLGIGSELRGDDAVGLEIARQLKQKITAPSCQVIEAGTSPENFTSILRQFAPAVVLLIDAAQMDEPPGTIRWLSSDDIAALPATTHALPLNLLAQYLQKEINCQIALIGIQPLHTDFQAPITKSILLAMGEVVMVLEEYFLDPGLIE